MQYNSNTHIFTCTTQELDMVMETIVFLGEHVCSKVVCGDDVMLQLSITKERSSAYLSSFCIPYKKKVWIHPENIFRGEQD